MVSCVGGQPHAKLGPIIEIPLLTRRSDVYGTAERWRLEGGCEILRPWKPTLHLGQRNCPFPYIPYLDLEVEEVDLLHTQNLKPATE